MDALRKDEIIEIENMESEERQSFKVHDIDSANWCFRKLSALAKSKTDFEVLAEHEHKRIDAWLKRECESIKNTTEFFEKCIEDYLVEQKALDPKFKISTPYGKASTRKQQPKFTYDDEKVLSSLKQLGLYEYVRTKEEVNKAELKKNINIIGNVATNAHGEVIEGITIEEQEDKIVISVEV